MRETKKPSFGPCMAALAMAAGLAYDQQNNIPIKRRRVNVVGPSDWKQRAEIAAWNEAVDRRKAEKKARKGGLK